MQNSITTLKIDLNNIRHNFRELKKVCSTSEVGSVVKADAYGLGVNKIAPILLSLGCKHFFVSNYEEGVALRLVIGNSGNIYVLHGVFYNEIKYFIEYNLVPVLNHLEQVRIWQDYVSHTQRNLPCMLHLDTGMNRLGIKESVILKSNLESQTNNLNILYVISHLTCAEDIDSNYNKIQLRRFTNITNKKFKNVPKSFANSSGIFLGSNYHFDLVRAGGAIYGVSPINHLHHSVIKPVVSLSAPIIQISTLLPGERVGYNGTYILKKNTKNCIIATIPVGYGNGFLTSLSNKGKVVIQNYTAPIIGRISMDLMVIDISNIPHNLLYLGQTVELLGDYLTVNKVAKLCKITGHEILTSIALRSKKIYS